MNAENLEDQVKAMQEELTALWERGAAFERELMRHQRAVTILLDANGKHTVLLGELHRVTGGDPFSAGPIFGSADYDLRVALGRCGIGSATGLAWWLRRYEGLGVEYGGRDKQGLLFRVCGSHQ